MVFDNTYSGVIGNNIFKDCTSITSVDFGGATHIGKSVFRDCIGLTTINFGNVTVIEASAFRGCTNLTDVDLAGITTTIGQTFRSTGLRTIDLKDVVTLGGEDFKNCTDLTSIVFGNNIDSIGLEIVLGCTALTDITFTGATPPTTLDNDALNGMTALTIHVPAGSIAAYSAKFSTIMANNPSMVLTFVDDVVAPPAPSVATPSTTTTYDSGERSSSSGSGKSFIALQPSTHWVDITEAKALIKKAETKKSSFVTTRGANSTGIRKAALEMLVGKSYYHDAVSLNSVKVRIYINPTAKPTKDLLLSGYVSGAKVAAIKNEIAKTYKNKVQVINLEQQISFGQTVEIAAMLDLSKMDTKNLVFYSYNKATGKAKLIATPNYRIDSKKYLHFSTQLAGNIVVSEGELVSNSL